MIDIAVPRDIDSRCGDIDGVTLYDIDDLQAVVQRNLGARREIVPQAEQIVEEEIHRFARWLGQAETLPTVSALREHGNRIVEQILSENEGRWESASERDLMRVEAVARAVLGRLLHEPTIRLRSISAERAFDSALQEGSAHGGASAATDKRTSGHAMLQLVRELFGLDTPQGGIPHGGGRAGEEPAREAKRAEAQAEQADETLAEVRSIQSARKSGS